MRRDEDIKAACGLVLDGKKPLGSCFRITERFALTCAHVPQDAAQVTVRFGAELVAGTIDTIDRDADVALIELAVPALRWLQLARAGRFGEAWRTFGYPAIARASDGGVVGHWFRGTINDLDGLDTIGQEVIVLESAMIKDERAHGLSGSPVLVDGVAIGLLKRILPRGPGEPTAAFGFLYATSVLSIRGLLARAGVPGPLAMERTTDGPGSPRPIRVVTLRQMVGSLRGEFKRFELPMIRVGRNADNDLEVMHQRVSQHHGVLFFRGDALCYQDTSRGGSTLLSGAQTQSIGFEEIVEVPVPGAIELGDGGARIEIASIGKGRRGES